MKISEILWKAANEHLSTNDYWDDDVSNLSCCAAARAEGLSLDNWRAAAKNSEAVQFLRSLGCGPYGSARFNKFEEGTERQGARYSWLMFASMIADEVERGKLKL